MFFKGKYGNQEDCSYGMDKRKLIPPPDVKVVIYEQSQTRKGLDLSHFNQDIKKEVPKEKDSLSRYNGNLSVSFISFNLM